MPALARPHIPGFGVNCVKVESRALRFYLVEGTPVEVEVHRWRALR